VYAQDVSDKQVESAARALGIQPERHSLADCRRNKSHFDALLDSDTGKLKRDLYEDEIAWIRNERVICTWDYGYWSRNYGVILDWRNDLVVYKQNVAQSIINEIQSEMERNRFSVLLCQLKARQLGVSTDTELKVAHRVQFHPNVNAAVFSARPDSSLKMSKMMERNWDNQPWWLLPSRGRWATSDVPGVMEFSALKSVVSIQHGAQKLGIARGDTPTVFHGSEIGEIDNAEELIEAALLNAVHESPWVFGVLEGTGAGKHNWWFRNWQYIKANWPSGRSRLRPIFLPWYVGTDIWPTTTWVKMHPIPTGWIPEEGTRAHANRAKHYVEHNDLLRKYLGSNWEMPPEQQWFWEVTKHEAKEKGTLAKFFAELASDDIESFQSPGNSVLDAEVLSSYRDRTQDPVGVYALTGPTHVIPAKDQPSKRETDSSKKSIKINEDFRLVPLKYQGVSDLDPIGKVLIWELPEEGAEYGLGIDTSNGVGGDRSIIEVLKKGTIHAKDRQVCEWVNPYLNAEQMTPYVHAIATYYQIKASNKQPKLVIEQAAGGNILQRKLRLQLGWSNFHVDLRHYDRKSLDRSKAPNIGWHTTPLVRDALITTLLSTIRNDEIDIYSPWLIEELGDLHADEITQKIAAERGAHDDRPMAIGMVLCSLHDLETRSKMPTVAQQRAELETKDESAPRWNSGFQGRDFGARVSPVWEHQETLNENYEPEEAKWK
jgi:hypothetical protein